MSKQTTISVSPETLATWNELSKRTKIPISELLREITENIQRQLDLMEKGKKLLFLSDLYIDPNVATLPKVIIRLSSTMGLNDLPSEIQEAVSKQYKEELVKERDAPELDVTLEGTVDLSKKGHLDETLRKIEENHPRVEEAKKDE